MFNFSTLVVLSNAFGDSFFAVSETFFTLTVADFESLVVFALAVGGVTALEVLDNF